MTSEEHKNLISDCFQEMQALWIKYGDLSNIQVPLKANLLIVAAQTVCQPEPDAALESAIEYLRICYRKVKERKEP